MMVGVVNSVRDGYGRRQWQIAPNTENTIGNGVVMSECQIVSNLVYGATKRMVENGPGAVRQDEDGGPGGVTHQPGDAELQQDLEHDDIHYERVGSHQLLDLRVLLENGLPPGGVRLLHPLPGLVRRPRPNVQAQTPVEPLKRIY